MTLLAIMIICVVMSILGAYLEDKYYVDKTTGDILFYYDNNYDYHFERWGKHDKKKTSQYR